MNSQEILEIYETVASITDQMLTAARNRDWESLTELEARCAAQIATLKAGESHAALTEVGREHKVRIIRKILEDDREIRSITEPWMAELSELIRSTGTERKLYRAYGANRSG